MSKSLVLAEKPSVGRELARVLGCKAKGNGCIIGEKYIVTWALGHLVTLADPDHYSDEYKAWRLESLPMLPKKMELVVIGETKKQFAAVKALMKLPEISELIIATDAGREGELVARWIIQKAGFKKPIKRLWISSQTDRAIKEGFAALKSSKEYDNLFASALCRAEADWLVGLNTTRALTCKYNAQLSAGRVQTPTLAIIVERENEIKRFVPKKFSTILAKLQGFSATWFDSKTKETRIFDPLKADELIKKLKNAEFTVKDVKKEQKKESVPLLYDLTELQRDANRKYGFSAKKTLSVMQQLYEIHKLLTYPRTDSKYISEDIVDTLPERVKSVGVAGYADFSKEIIRTKAQIAKKCVDNSKVSDHHAIIPTEQYVNLSNLTADEKHIYDLVVRRFLAAFFGDAVYDQTSVILSAKDELFSAKGRVIREKGFKKLYEKISDDTDEGDEPVQTLPEIKSGSMLPSKDVMKKEGETKPPARYTEATLLSAMEHPGKFIENAQMKEIIEKTSGLGTPATRAEIIERLLSAFYVERRGNSLVPTSKGMQLIDIVPKDLKEPELTAKWEQELQRINKGTAKSHVFMEDIAKYTDSLVKKVIASTAAYKHDNLSTTRCPSCDKFLLEVNGKKGKMLVCQDRECGYRQSLSMITTVRCPSCRKPLEVFGQDEKRIYICPCGFREKYDKYNQRINEDRKNSSKREVEEYMKKQKSENTGNTAFASAFDAAFKKAEKK